MISAAVVFLSLVIGASVLAPTPVERAEKSVIRLIGKDFMGRDLGSGTGFAVKTKKGHKVIVTNAHVCEGFRQMYSTYEEETYKLNVIKISKKTDLCMLQAPKSIPALKLASNVDVDQEIYTVGFPYSEYMVTESGKYKGPTEAAAPWDVPIEKCKGRDYLKVRIIPTPGDAGLVVPKRVCIGAFDDMIFTTIISAPGASGSPIVDGQGKIVGVIFMIHRGGAPWAIGVSLEKLEEFLG